MVQFPGELLLPLLAICSAAEASLHPNPSLGILNSSLNGRIKLVEPFALPCFSKFEGKHIARDEATCNERQTNYRDPMYRRQFPGAYMYDTSSINASDPTSLDQCLLDIMDPKNSSAWNGRDCKRGNLPSHYLDVQSACDAIQVFAHAQHYGQKISIKNSGHTYVEDASAADSLVLWTQNLKRLRYNSTFVPKGCPTNRNFNTITTGAGVGCGEAYEFADKNNVTIVCGYSPTVGVSGGWAMGGGHSVLSNAYGLGADRVLQFKIVTPDGKLRIANECHNGDLFWALRGGGGGTYGLVLESTHLVESETQIAVASIGFPSNEASDINAFMDLLVDTAIDIAEGGWGGHIYGNRIVHVSPNMKTVAEAKRSMEAITDFAVSHGGSSNITMSPTFYKFFHDYVLTGSYSVGNLQLIGTQLAPIKLFTDEGHKRALKSFFRSELAKGNVPYIPVGSPYLARQKRRANQTSVNPAWYDSLWEPGIGASFSWNSTFKERVAVVQELQKGTKSLQKLTLGGGAYKNEANPFTTNWKEVWYGKNYNSLLEIKQKYDPHGILKCWGCVGWTEHDAAQSSYTAFVGING